MPRFPGRRAAVGRIMSIACSRQCAHETYIRAWRTSACRQENVDVMIANMEKTSALETSSADLASQVSVCFQLSFANAAWEVSDTGS